MILFVGRTEQHGLSIFVSELNKEYTLTEADNSLVTTLNDNQSQN